MTPNRLETLPQPALLLGLAGLIPFVALAVQVAAGRPLDPRMTGPALYALLIYGAVILSFLGGIQWGLAVASADRSDAWRRYGLSVLPSLVAWAGMWVGGQSGLITLAVGVGLWGLYELWSTGLGEAPRWYGRMRLALTAVVVTALGAAARFGPF